MARSYKEKVCKDGDKFYKKLVHKVRRVKERQYIHNMLSVGEYAKPLEQDEQLVNTYNICDYRWYYWDEWGIPVKGKPHKIRK